eukprot:476096_1
MCDGRASLIPLPQNPIHQLPHANALSNSRFHAPHMFFFLATKDLLLMLLFGIQLLGAYFLMLIVMLYEPWMFFMVIAGLMTGYFIAVRFSGIYGGSRRRKAEVDTGMTCECGIPIKKQPEGPENIAPTTPCCGF